MKIEEYINSHLFNLGHNTSFIIVWLLLMALLLVSYFGVPKALARGIKPRKIAIPLFLITLPTVVEGIWEFVDGSTDYVSILILIIMPLFMYGIRILNVIRIKDILKAVDNKYRTMSTEQVVLRKRFINIFVAVLFSILTIFPVVLAYVSELRGGDNPLIGLKESNY